MLRREAHYGSTGHKNYLTYLHVVITCNIFHAYGKLYNKKTIIAGDVFTGQDSRCTIFAKWLEPFYYLDAKNMTIDNTGGTTHLAFDAAGIPGFEFIQAEVEYDTRAYHTNMGTYDQLVPADLKQASTKIASLVYNRAQPDQKMPGKNLPKAK